ncbi:MAG: redoxin domain-containing protein [Bryobacteraceae bacterium]
MQRYSGGCNRGECAADNTPSLGVFAKQLGVSFPLLSDFMRKTSADDGVLMADRGIANRTTFVVDMQGKIQHIEEGTQAIDISGAANACSRLAHK